MVIEAYRIASAVIAFTVGTTALFLAMRSDQIQPRYQRHMRIARLTLAAYSLAICAAQISRVHAPFTLPTFYIGAAQLCGIYYLISVLRTNRSAKRDGASKNVERAPRLNEAP